MDLIETVSQAPGCSHFSSCPTVMYSTQPKSTNMLFPHLNILNRLAPMISQSWGDLLRVLGATDTITSKDMLTTYSTQHCCVEYFGTAGRSMTVVRVILWWFCLTSLTISAECWKVWSSCQSIKQTRHLFRVKNYCIQSTKLVSSIYSCLVAFIIGKYTTMKTKKRQQKKTKKLKCIRRYKGSVQKPQ